MQTTVETDITIIGGGIAGLWLLNRVRQQGYTAILLESGTLGGCQTHKAQGIIHGGTKYALQGNLTDAAKAIADMPKLWRSCLAGTGEIDLTHVPVLSDYQYLFSTNKIAAKLAGFFANLTLNGNVSALAPEAYPDVFKHSHFKGVVYALDEMAIDVPILVRELVKPNQDVIYKINPLTAENLNVGKEGLSHIELQVLNEKINIHSQKYIFTAGAGNEMLTPLFPQAALATQRRPLHMVVVKTEFNFPVFAHCLGLSATPRMTITTHQSRDGKTIWYLGGQIAEEGVKLNAKAQIQTAKKELMEIFPWLDFSTASFASFFVDRAEPLQAGGKRPDSSFYKEIENVIAAWPTKLAFAPKLANDILFHLDKANIKKGNFDTRALRTSPMPSLATPIWDKLFNEVLTIS